MIATQARAEWESSAKNLENDGEACSLKFEIYKGEVENSQPYPTPGA